MSQFFFSIVTVSFNSIATIERTIRSVKSQSFSNYEYLVVDGNSSDGTKELLQLFYNNGDVDFLISEPDNGLYDAMNKGILHSRGRYVVILNSDDELCPNALEHLYQFIVSKDNDVNVYTGNVLYESGNYLQLLTNSPKRFKAKCSILTNPVRHPATIVSLETYRKFGVFDKSLKIFADQDLMLKYVQLNLKFEFFDFPFTIMHEGGVSTRMNNLFKFYSEHSLIVDRYCQSNIKCHYLKYIYFFKQVVKFIYSRSKCLK